MTGVKKGIRCTAKFGELTVAAERPTIEDLE